MSTWVAGKFGQCARFENEVAYEFPTIVLIPGMTEIILDAYFYVESLPTGTYITPLRFDDQSSANMDVLLYNDGSLVVTSALTPVIELATVIETGKWYRIRLQSNVVPAATSETANIYLYDASGAIETLLEHIGNLSLMATNSGIGNVKIGSISYYDGNVRIDRVVLTTSWPAQIFTWELDGSFGQSVDAPTDFVRTSAAGQKNPAFGWTFPSQTAYQLVLNEQGIAVPSFIGAAQASSAGDAATVDFSALSLATNDVLVAFVHSGGVLPDVPAGWTQATSQVGGAASKSRSFYKVFTSGDATTQAFTASGGSGLGAVLTVWRNLLTGDLLDDSDADFEVTTTTPDTPSATASVDGALILAAFIVDSPGVTATSPAGMTERADHSQDWSGSISVHSEIQAGAGATGTKEATTTAAVDTHSHILVLKPSDVGAVVYDTGKVASSAQSHALAWADRLAPGTYFAFLYCWNAYDQISEAATL